MYNVCKIYFFPKNMIFFSHYRLLQIKVWWCLIVKIMQKCVMVLKIEIIAILGEIIYEFP